MTPKENANHFTELGKRSLLLDILIDCEEYDEFDKCALKCLGKSRKDDEKKSAASSFDELCKMIKNKVNKINNDIEKGGGKLNVANYAEIIADFTPIQKLLRKIIRQESMENTKKGESYNSGKSNQSNISRQYKILTEMLMKGIPSLIQNKCLDEYLKAIVISKYIRRLLKDTELLIAPKIIEEIYKNLTQILIIIVPQISDSEILNKSRIIFLNEISAVSQGHLAIGYAEMALSELKELTKNWLPKNNSDERLKHPYELYALYNKGLTLAHDPEPGNTEKAKEIFSQIIKKSFENSKNTDIPHAFEKDYPEEKDLFPIFFWLIYVPTKYQLSEIYADLNASYDREKMISDVFEALEKLNGKIHLFENSKLTDRIKHYYNVKFTIQYIFSKIDSGNFAKKIDRNKVTTNWPKVFKKESYKDIFNDHDFQEFKEKQPSIIKSRLDSVEALFWLEFAIIRKSGKNYNILNKCFGLCIKYLIKDNVNSDWSDFAITFLHGVIFTLQNHKENKPWPECLEEIGQNKEEEKDNSSDEAKWKVSFQKTYKIIFKKLQDPEWIARKKDLVETFMKCQGKIIQQYENWEEKEKGESKRNKYLKYQIELIGKIFSDEEGRIFKKSWPDCEKERLGKNLNETIKSFKYKDLLDWWDDAKSEFDEKVNRHSADASTKCNHWEKNFKEIIKKMQNTLSNDTYTLPDDLSAVANFIKDKMNCDFYTRKFRLNIEKFYDHLIYKSCRPSIKNHYALTVLRRWQSFTPALSSGSEVGQKGGGYFVYKTNGKGEIEEGLVIDPGFNFLENFFEEGFSIRDIKAILMTHSHPDHSSDFMSIMTLVREMNKRGKRVFGNSKRPDRKLVLFMTEGCHQNFAEQLNRNTETFKDIIEVKQGSNENYGEDAFLNCFKLTVTKANHNDLADYDSVGYVISDNSGKPLLGFTGDTQWYYGIEEQYKDCPVICMNIGGVVDIFKKPEIKLSDICNKDDTEHISNIKTILLRENHLYLPGFYLMAKKFNKKQKLLIISELCEEMKGGLRTDLAKKISGDIKIPILPEDIGLTVVLNNKKNKKTGNVFCKICQSEHPPKEIVAVETDKDNAIIYLCQYHYNKLKEGSSLPKINELKLDANELHNPLIKEDSAGLSPCLKKIIGK